MLLITFFLLLVLGENVRSLTWNTSGEIRPWEAYLQLGDIQRPLGLTLDPSSLAHRHFYIGYLCLNAFMYDVAQEAFDMAINISSTFIEPYIGKMLGCKQSLWSYTNFTCGLGTYNAAQQMQNTSNITLSNLQSSVLSTVYQWYANQSSTDAGEAAFLVSITNVSLTYSNETDIGVLRGLSLLNVADQTQYQTIMEPPAMVQSRDVLKAALQNEPNHPGALHYLIHAYDVVNVDIANQARPYALLYGNIVITSSHGQHMPSHIWMRTGSWNLALSADGTGIMVSLTLCATKLLAHNVSVYSTELKPYFALFNTTDQISLLLRCDAENRAHSTEWLAYSRLQTGNWLGSIAVLRDQFTADSQSTLTPNQYLPFAYRTQARTIVELFNWFNYNMTFLSRTQQLLAFNGTQTLVSMGANTTRWYPIWSEAGLRFSECLRLVPIFNADNNTSIIDNHLAFIADLSNKSAKLNQYVSASISMMIPQIRGCRYYVNESWQDSLNELNNATQREATLVADANTPTLIFARSSELLAMHLLLIHKKYMQQSGRMLLSTYMLNNISVSITDFPSRALALYQQANISAPNRAINTLGMARAYTQLSNHTEAVKLYRVLLTQMTYSNDSDPIFSQEANEIIAQNTTIPPIVIQHSTATNNHFFLSTIFILSFSYFL